MKYLLFGGSPNVGKSETLTRIATMLISNSYGFTIDVGSIPPIPTIPVNPIPDFKVILERKNINGRIIRILINSATDDEGAIDRLIIFLDENSPVDIIISSVRDIYKPRFYFFSKLNILPVIDFVFEIPLAKITRRNDDRGALNWYKYSIDELTKNVLMNNPFNL